MFFPQLKNDSDKPNMIEGFPKLQTEAEIKVQELQARNCFLSWSPGIIYLDSWRYIILYLFIKELAEMKKKEQEVKHVVKEEVEKLEDDIGAQPIPGKKR